MSTVRKAGCAEALEPRRLLSVVPTPAHVVVVIEENHSYNEIIGNSQAPYINSLAPGGALFTNSFAIEHPSQPNYLDLFSGSNHGVTDDNTPVGPFTGDLGAELISAGQTFGGYSESMPSTGYTGDNAAPYARKHNPWVDFSDVPWADNMPFSSFPSNYNNLPTVSFVVPNLNNDMHDGTINQGDQWLQTNIGPYATWAQSHNSLLIVTWDEDDSSQSNQIPTIFYGQPVKAGTYSETINHFSVLRTIEDMYGLSYAGASAGASPITDAWLTLNPASDVITGTSSPDQISLVQDQDHQHIDWVMGSQSGQLLINDPSGLTINDTVGNNTITVNNASGNPLPSALHLNGTFTITGLQSGNPLAGTNLEIGRSTVFLNYAGSSDPLATIRGYLKNGYNNGAWNGAASSSSGVITSTAASSNSLQTTGIGYADAADGLSVNTIANTIELKYTLYGDTGLAGTVGFSDFTRVTQHYGQSGASWDTGDFNYDASVNFTDFTLMTRTYNSNMSSQAAPASVSSTTNAISAAVARHRRHHRSSLS